MIASKPMPTGKVSRTTKLPETPELRFIRRFSSIKEEYETGRRASIQAGSKVRASRVPNLATIQPGQKTSEKLWSTTSSWKMQDLYVETLTGLFPSLEAADADSSKLVDFLQKLHRFQAAEHRACLETAKRRKVRTWVLNLEIIEAKDLPATDVNGLSDPFCTLGWSTRKDLSFRTVVCPETLNPVWNEFFTIPLTSSNGERENLKIKVWDQDPEERKRDKLKRIGEIKSTQGFWAFWKDLRSGKAKQELIGTVTIPATHTESEVIDKWFPLENTTGQGQLRVRMALGMQKERMAALHDYKKIMQLLLIHDLENAPSIEPYTWTGTLVKNNWADYIQRQLGWAWSLKPHQVLLAQWCAYNRIHLEFPLSMSIFPTILKPILASLENPLQSRLDEQYTEFWGAVRRLILYFETFIQNIHDQLSTAEIASRIEEILKTVSLLYDHLSKSPDGANELKITASKLVGRLEEAISNGASLHFQKLLEDHELDEESVVSDSKTSLKRISSLGTQLQEDLNLGQSKLQSVFKTFKLNYFASTYRVYDVEYARLVEPVVAQICRSLSQEAFQPIHIGEMVASNNEDYVQLTTQLFALFLSVKQFAALSRTLGGAVANLRVAGVFHNWFRPAVLHWWESLRCVITPCIQNAVKLEGTKAIDHVYCERLQSNVSYEAVSVASTLSEIAVVWKNLEWPIVEESYDFVVNILKQLWAHAMYYSQLLSDKICEFEGKSGSPYFISESMCIWVNNMKYIVEEGSKPVISGIDVNGFLKSLALTSGIQQSASAAEQIERLHSDSREIIISEAAGVFEKTCLRMKPEISRLFLKASENPNKLEVVSSEYLKYMDRNFNTLREHLSPCNFELAFEKLWEGCLNIVRNIIQYGLNNHKGPEFFQSVQSLFILTKDFFHGAPDDTQKAKSSDETDRSNANANSNSDHTQNEIKSLLDIHSATSSDLKIKYYQERCGLQSSSTAHGILTVKVHYCPGSNLLIVNVLNAKNLKSYDSDGNSDPYVEIRIVPTELYENIRRLATGIQKATLFPLFDETFNIPLTPDQMKSEGFLHFAVYDYDFIGKNDFHGEALLPLDKIEFTDVIPKTQISMNLDKPSREHDSILKTLERRHWDKAAVKFVKNEYSNMNLE